jgi:hypothetical protein
VKSALALIVLCSCTVPNAYLVAPEDAAPKFAPVNAVRFKDNRAVVIRGETIDPLGAIPQPDGRVRVVSRAKSRKLTAGVLMTFIGSAISIAGTIVFFVGNARNDSTLMQAGYIAAPSAEPIMITGTVLWVLGARSHPQEIP